jgi:hypothetical protein
MTENTAALRRVRKSFEMATGLRTYSISWINRGEKDLFEADAPWAESHHDAVLEWMTAAEAASGKSLDVDIRNTRMTIRFA